MYPVRQTASQPASQPLLLWSKQVYILIMLIRCVFLQDSHVGVIVVLYVVVVFIFVVMVTELVTPQTSFPIFVESVCRPNAQANQSAKAME